MGPNEIVTISSPDRFNGDIVPELQKLVDADTVTVIDGVFATKTRTA